MCNQEIFPAFTFFGPGALYNFWLGNKNSNRSLNLLRLRTLHHPFWMNEIIRSMGSLITARLRLTWDDISWELRHVRFEPLARLFSCLGYVVELRNVIICLKKTNANQGKKTQIESGGEPGTSSWTLLVLAAASAPPPDLAVGRVGAGLCKCWSSSPPLHTPSYACPGASPSKSPPPWPHPGSKEATTFAWMLTTCWRAEIDRQSTANPCDGDRGKETTTEWIGLRLTSCIRSVGTESQPLKCRFE